MIEAVDWPSFGYGAGALAVSTYAWSARGPILRARDRVQLWLERRTFDRATVEEKVKYLSAELDALNERVHEVQKQTMQVSAARVAERQKYEREVLRLAKALERTMVQDAAWENYQRRKKGLPPVPIGRGAASLALAASPESPALRWCGCGHTSWEHVVKQPVVYVGGFREADCRSCECDRYEEVQ